MPGGWDRFERTSSIRPLTERIDPIRALLASRHSSATDEELGRVGAGRPVVIGGSGGQVCGVKRGSNANGNSHAATFVDASNLFQFQQEEKQKESNLTKAVSCLAW